MLSFRKMIYLLVVLACSWATGSAQPSGDERGAPTYYDLLGVSTDADDATIRKSYRKMALLHHPDKASTGDREQKEALFVRLANAYEVLSDKILRKRYDYLLSVGATEYEDRGWDEFDRGGRPRTGAGSAARPMTREEAMERLRRVEEQEWHAFLISVAVAGVLASLPILHMWRRKCRKGALLIDPAVKRAEQAAAEAARLVKAQREAEEREYDREIQKARREALERLRQEEGSDAEEEPEDHSDAEVAPDGQPRKRPQRARPSGDIYCDLCRKDFKSDKQLENHKASKKHKDALKKQSRAKKVEN